MNYAGKFDANLSADALGLHLQGQVRVETITHHATHAPADAIIVADPHLLFNGDFKRSGVDLILSGDDHELLLRDYFKTDKRAPLSSPDGAHLTGDIVTALTGHTQFAQASGASAGKVIGHVSKLAGTATAVRNGVSIILNNGDNVEKGDVVQSGSDSTLGITFIDGTVFGLSSNARMVLNEMVYDPNGSSNSSLLSLVAGTITFVAGETAKHGDMKVDTPVATMGIRGTAVLVEVDFEIPLGLPAQSPPPSPSAKFQVLVEPDGTTGSYILFDKNTLTPIATVNQAGQQINISQGQVTITNAPLPPDIQKLITDVFSLKFTSNDNNPKTFDHFTDTVVPQSLQSIMLANGATAIPVIVNVNTAEKSSSSGSGGPLSSLDHIPGPPSVVVLNGSFVERAGVTHDSTVDILSNKITFADINAGDLPTVSVKFDSFSYQNAAHQDVTATLNAQQLADVNALELSLGVVPDIGNKNTGSATWTYSLADSAFDFLGADETVTLTYMARVDNNFALNNEFTIKPFTITITGTNDAPTIAATNAVLTQHSGVLDHAGGTITFDDVDLTDRPVVSTAFTSFSFKDAHGNDITSTLTAGQQAAIAAVEASLSLTPSPSNANDGSIAWSYDVPDGDLGFLADGETLTLTYLASVDDGHGGTTSTPITVTIIGSGNVPHLVTELPGHTGDTVDHDTVTGTLAFAGVGIASADSILVSAIWSGGGSLPNGLVGVLESSFTVSGTSSVDFTFSPADSNFDFLAEGETLTLIFDVNVVDSHGLSSTRPVTFIVTGTNDAPTIVAGSTSATGAVTELVSASQPNPTGSTAFDTATGLVTFADVDLSDTHVVTVTGVATSGTTSGLPSDAATMLGWFSLGTVAESANSATGSDGWTFSAQDKSFDYLAAGESVSLIYTVQVDDGHGGVVTQPVTITVTGTNDTPAITGGIETGAITERSNGAQPNPTGSSALDTASGSVTFSDVDLSDHHTVTVTGVASSGTTSGLPTNPATMLGWLSLAPLSDSTSGVTGSDGWTFSAQDKSFDYLAAGESVSLIYAVRVDDGHGGAITQPVTITITGTNDTPVITSGIQSAAITELSNDAQPNPTGSSALDTASGAVTFSDVDLSDHHTVTVTGVASSGTTSGLPGNSTMLGWLSLGALTDSTGSGIGGSGGWSFSAQDKSFDYLAGGESVTLIYTVQVDDGHGGVVTQPVTITITGTNDTPAIATASGAIAELSGTHNASIDHAGGSISFADVDLTDHPLASAHYASFAYENAQQIDITATLTAQQLAAVAAVEASLTLTPASGNTNIGSVAWSYDVPDNKFDFLAAGDTLTLTYTATVDDTHGGTISKPVSVTITGTNDTPTILGETNAATQAVIVLSPVTPTILAPGLNTNSLGLNIETFDSLSVGSASNNGAGHGNFNSATLDATFTASGNAGVVTGSSAVSAAPFIGPLPGAQDTTKYLSIGAGGTETITFDHEQNAFGLYWGSLDSFNTIKFYDGATLVASYTGADISPLLPTGNQSTFSTSGYVEFSNLASFDKVVLGTGNSNAFEIDNISAGSVPESHVELSAPISGNLTVSDADIGDTLTASVVGNAHLEYNGSTTLPNNVDVSALIAANAITFDTVKSNGGVEVLHWTYDPTNPDLDFMKSGDTLTITFTAQVNDGHVSVGNQPLTITLAGTETPKTSGFEVVNGTSGNDMFVNVGGNTTIFGAGGQDTFVFNAGFGSATIGDFDVNKDTIGIDHALVANVSALLASAQPINSGHDTLLTDAFHDTITLTGVTVAQIQAHQAAFHLV